MYDDFCRLKHDPFAETPDPEFLFLSPSHKAALQALSSGIEARQELMALFGTPGLGKTTILRACQTRIPPHSQMIFIGYPKLSFRDVLACICQECGLDCATDSPTAMLSHLYQTWHEAHNHGGRVVLLIDEAHHLPVPTLESFFHLFMLQTATGEHLFQIVLAGFPELQDTLNLPLLRPLRKRLTVRVTLAPLTPEESRAYIGHRLNKVLMLEDELFTPGAIKRIIRYAHGNPRVLNTLCSNMLISASLRRQKPVSARLAREVIADVGPKSPRPSLRWRAVAAAGLLLGAGVGWGWQSQWLGSAKRGARELFQHTQSLTDRFHDLTAARSVEGPGLAPPSALVTLPPHAIPEQQPPVSPPALTRPSLPAPEPVRPRESATTTSQERQPPPLHTVPRPASAQPPVASVPAIKGLKALDQARLYEPDTTASVGQSPADIPNAGRETTPTAGHSPAAAAKVQTVHFHSLPNAATVFIDGREVGRTPLTARLSMGSHTILVEKPYYTSISYQLNIDRTEESHLYHDLHEDGSR